MTTGVSVHQIQGVLKVIKVLGSGSFGTAYSCMVDGYDDPVAVKLLCEANRQAHREVALCTQLQHPHLLKLHGVLSSDPLCLVYQLCSGGTLQRVLYRSAHRESISLSQRVQAVLEVVSAVAYLHGRDIIHRDIKPGNVFLSKPLEATSGAVRVPPMVLGDLGFVRLAEGPGHEMTQCIGTLCYMAPEVISDNEYGVGADVYSCAVLLHEVCTGKQPFADVHCADQQLLLKVLSGLRPSLELLPDACVGNELRGIIAEAWTADVGSRLTAASMEDKLHKLCHPAGPPTPKPKTKAQPAARVIFAPDVRPTVVCVDQASPKCPKAPVTPNAPKPKSGTTTDVGQIQGVTKVVKVLGSGSFGTVYSCTVDGHQELVAVKLLVEANRQAHREVELCMQLRHPHLLRLEKVLSNDPLCLVYQLCSGGTLHRVMYRSVHRKSISLAQRVQAVREVVSAVSYLHTKDIIHRDIKPGNIFLSKPLEAAGGVVRLPPVVLGDLGFARLAEGPGHEMTQCIGTILYMAPEVIVDNEYGVSADVYSCAVLMHEIATGQQPFADVHLADQQLLLRVISGLRPSLELLSDSDAGKRLAAVIAEAWVLDVDQRLTSAAMEERLGDVLDVIG